MAFGLAALLDDIAAITKYTASSLDDVAAATARAGSKSLGVVVDDTAVTPQYLQGVTPDRELPIIRRITLGSLRNKLIFILPVILILSQFVPWVLTPLLMLGGTYLCFEGAEKILEWLHERRAGHHGGEHDEAAASEHNATTDTARTTAHIDEKDRKESEDEIVRGAVTTDFILSAEIMVIALDSVATETLIMRALVLCLVAVAITLGVYGVVAIIVKLDDVGLRWARTDSPLAQKVGHSLVSAMPILLRILTVVGTIAMLWVGGHLLVLGAEDLGWGVPHHVIATVAHPVEAVPALGVVLHWLVETTFLAVIGFGIGALVVGIVHVVRPVLPTKN